MTLVVEAPQDVESVVAPRPPGVDRFPTRVVVLAMMGSVALRARFITTPLSADEGGYLAVARAWASGKALYTEAWVDRPQGLLLLFRFWDRLTGGSAESIRVMAILFGCVAVAAVAYAVFAIAGQRAAAVASILVAVASANARIEGFIANGELLAGTVAAAGVAAACAYLFRGRGQSWLFISGLLAGCAISIKQSGFDGFLAVMVCVLVGGMTGERSWRQAVREGALCLAGLATVLSALLLHGIFLGFSSWWYALAGYRIGGLNASDGDWHRFGVTRMVAAPTIIPLLAAAIFGLVKWLVSDRRITRSTVLLPAWVCFAALAFVTGGLFHRHYWVTLTFPLAAAAAVGIASHRRLRINSRALIAVTCLVAVPSLISTADVIELDRSAAALVAHDDPRLVVNEQVGKWYNEHRTHDSTLYALCASAALYAYADAIPPYPYLWLDGVQHGKGAQEQLVELFSGDHPPTFVVEYQSVSTCNPSGRVAALLYQRYDTVATVAGASILVLRDGAATESRSDRRAFSTAT
jgi:dolichyl-phosphate-mannose-protein mannosyltransferase